MNALTRITELCRFRTLGVAVQDKAPRIPTLRYMVRNIHGNHASETGQNKKLSGIRSICPQVSPHRRIR
jgi:hypothetical protein